MIKKKFIIIIIVLLLIAIVGIVTLLNYLLPSDVEIIDYVSGYVIYIIKSFGEPKYELSIQVINGGSIVQYLWVEAWRNDGLSVYKKPDQNGRVIFNLPSGEYLCTVTNHNILGISLIDLQMDKTIIIRLLLIAE